MYISGLEKLSLVDYDGYTAATVFTPGCNFRCPFCHNASLVESNTFPKLQEEEVLAFLKKRLGLLEGVCITGGEPTLQKDLPAFIEKLKAIGYHVKLDTNGTNPEMLRSLLKNGLLDYVAMDIKHAPASYPIAIGCDYPFAPIQESIGILLHTDVPYEFRTTLIAEFHTEAAFQEIAKSVAGAPKYALQKFKSGDNCLDPTGLNPVSKEKATEFGRILENSVSAVVLRGYD